jgi:hypothetical protein
MGTKQQSYSDDCSIESISFSILAGVEFAAQQGESGAWSTDNLRRSMALDFPTREFAQSRSQIPRKNT